MNEQPGYRAQLWDYYDRRAEFRSRDALANIQDEDRWLGNALEYWHWLGVPASAADLQAEDTEVRKALRSLEHKTFLEVGSGPGTYTSTLPGVGIALDQSAAALRLLQARVPTTSVLRADALHLPLRDRSVSCVFATHIYGILDQRDRDSLVREARRVAARIVVVDSGRPQGVPAEQWQQRSSGIDQQTYNVLRRHFEASELASEIGGQVLFAGQFYVVVASEN
jgi:ubiquinone/menaquinone biosynthesis C-methylase UbiE